MLALGDYPNVSIAKARKSAQWAKEQLAEGVDPGLVRKIRKGTNATDNTFQAVADEWLEKVKHQWTESHRKSISGRLRRDIFPWIGARPVGEI